MSASRAPRRTGGRHRHPWLHRWCRGRCAYGRRWTGVRDGAFVAAVTVGVFVAAAAVPDRLVGTVLLVGLIVAGVLAERDRSSVPVATPSDPAPAHPPVPAHPIVGSRP